MAEASNLQKDYAGYRLERAKDDLEAARLLFQAGRYRIANNRAYYAIFHAMRAVLVFDNFDSSKHSGVIAEFRRRYIKSGIFPAKISKMIGAAFAIRNASDYDDMFIAGRQDTEEQIANAEYVYKVVLEYIGEIMNQTNHGETSVHVQMEKPGEAGVGEKA